MSNSLSRRSMLQVMGVTLLGSALAACVPIQAAPATPTVPKDSANDEAALKRVGDLLDKLYDTAFFSGAVLIARDGEILFNKAWGMADHQKNIANTPQTIFRLAE